MNVCSLNNKLPDVMEQKSEILFVTETSEQKVQLFKAITYSKVKKIDSEKLSIRNKCESAQHYKFNGEVTQLQ